MTKNKISFKFKNFVIRNFGDVQYIKINMLEDRIKDEMKRKTKGNNEGLPLLIIMQFLVTIFFLSNQQKKGDPAMYF